MDCLLLLGMTQGKSLDYIQQETPTQGDALLGISLVTRACQRIFLKGR